MTVPKPGWVAYLDVVSHDRIGSEVVWFWHCSRQIRRPAAQSKRSSSWAELALCLGCTNYSNQPILTLKNINFATSDIKYTLNVNSHVTVRRRSFKVSVSTMPRRSMVGGGDLSSCNSSSGPTWLTDICIGSTPARCHGIEAIERHKLPHNYPSWVHPLLDELQQASPRCRSYRKRRGGPKSHLLSSRSLSLPS